MSTPPRPTQPQRRAWCLAAVRCIGRTAGLGLLPMPGSIRATTFDEDPDRRMAASADGRWHLLADAHAPRLTLYDGTQPIKRWTVASLDGRQTSPVIALRHDAPRRSFVAALRDLPELWEISLDPQAEPILDGLVHDYRMAEAIASPGYLGVRRTRLERPLIDFRLDDDGRRVIGVPRLAEGCAPERWVIHLDVRLRIARLDADGRPVGGPPCRAPAQPPG